MVPSLQRIKEHLTLITLTIALSSVLGCEKTREAIHEMSRSPDAAATTPAATTPIPAIADAAATTAAVTAKDASADASKAAGVAKASSSATAKKSTPQPPLNGLAAGAICIQGAEGNGGCASGSECTGGKCTCYNGWTSCGGACRDLSRDPYNCDKCGRECQWGERCKWGNCER